MIFIKLYCSSSFPSPSSDSALSASSSPSSSPQWKWALKARSMPADVVPLEVVVYTSRWRTQTSESCHNFGRNALPETNPQFWRRKREMIVSTVTVTNQLLCEERNDSGSEIKRQRERELVSMQVLATSPFMRYVWRTHEATPSKACFQPHENRLIR